MKRPLSRGRIHLGVVLDPGMHRRFLPGNREISTPALRGLAQGINGKVMNRSR
jgi:hypothetical protein